MGPPFPEDDPEMSTGFPLDCVGPVTTLPPGPKLVGGHIIPSCGASGLEHATVGPFFGGPCGIGAEVREGIKFGLPCSCVLYTADQVQQISI